MPVDLIKIWNTVGIKLKLQRCKQSIAVIDKAVE
jgi:hypothetical protein